MTLDKDRTITFNRRLRLRWLIEALRLAAQGADTADAETQLLSMISAETPGADSVAKSFRYIRQLWFEPGDDVAALRLAAIDFYRQDQGSSRAALLCWGMVLARYPFVRQVAEIIGRLLRLQGDVKQEQLKRKVRETFGERETSVRSGRYAVSLINDFGFIRLEGRSGHYVKGATLNVEDPKLSAWLLQAVFLSLGSRKEIPKDELLAKPELFMIAPDTVLRLALTTNRFRLGRESFAHELVLMLD